MAYTDEDLLSRSEVYTLLQMNVDKPIYIYSLISGSSTILVQEALWNGGRLSFEKKINGTGWDSISGKYKYGWYISNKGDRDIDSLKILKIERVESKDSDQSENSIIHQIIKPIMKSLSKLLLDADTKTLIKAGYLREDLTLSPFGEEAMQTILFQANKVALVEKAKEEIAEEEGKQ